MKKKDIDLAARTIRFDKNVWRGQIQNSTKTDVVYEKHMSDRLFQILKEHLERNTIGPDDFVFRRSEFDPRPCDPDYVRREILYPALQRAGVVRLSRASGFHAFRRAVSQYLRKKAGLEVAAIQLGHKRMTTTDVHYNAVDTDDIVRAARLVEDGLLGFCPRS